ncbi:hypothetical protein BHE74_00046898 [Ensete ventricosum]|nr:hypothetical protein BHE74_00046898 [Ensete ventricosum]
MRATSQSMAYKPPAGTDYENIDEQLVKIRQISTIKESQIRFGRLTNQTRDWSEKQILKTFIEALKPKIQEEVKARQPYTLKAAISFARLHEDRMNQDAWRTKAIARRVAQRLSAPSTTSRDKLFLKCHIQLNQLCFLMQRSHISGNFHDFTKEWTMMLEVFLDDDL